jgi:hypothetical protein
MQMSISKPSHGFANFKLSVKNILLWIVLPVLVFAILILIAARYCFKKALRFRTYGSFIEEAGPNDSRPTENKL